MASFHYRAVSPAGDIVEGDMEASSPDAVAESLRGQGHFPLSVGTDLAVPAAARRPALRRSRRRAPSLGALAATSRELATLVGAGLPLDRSLRFAAEAAAERPLREALEQVLERVRGGATLADATRESTGAFPAYYSGMLRAGEAGGNLREVLEELAAYLDRLHTLRESLRSAMIYPVILAAMVVLTTVVMFVGILPKFRPLFADLGDDLPLLTQGFLAVGDFAEAWWWVGLLTLLAVTLFLRYRLRDPGFRLVWDRAKLSAPFIGDMIRYTETSRFARTLSMLLSGGLPLTEALRIVRDAVNNAVFRDGIDTIGKGLREGGRMADGVARTGIFPKLAVQLIQVGEEAGRLDGVLGELANSLERELQRMIQRALAVLIPAVTMFLGGVVALLILSILGVFLSVNDLAY